MPFEKPIETTTLCHIYYFQLFLNRFDVPKLLKVLWVRWWRREGSWQEHFTYTCYVGKRVGLKRSCAVERGSGILKPALSYVSTLSHGSINIFLSHFFFQYVLRPSEKDYYRHWKIFWWFQGILKGNIEKKWEE